MSLRIATWNMQGAFPKRKSHEKWTYLEDTICPDLAVLTEARPYVPSSYAQTYRKGGLGKGYPWGTVLATRSPLESREKPVVRRLFQEHDLYQTWPGSVVVCDIHRDGERVLTVVGVYAVTRDAEGNKVGHGLHTSRMIADDLKPLFKSRESRGIVLAGDLNLWPEDAAKALTGTGLVDLIETTASSRPASPACVCRGTKPCRHIWTHNNGFKGKYQQIDFILSTPDLADRLVSLTGGPDAFPDIWEYSDHAPLIAEFDL